LELAAAVYRSRGRTTSLALASFRRKNPNFSFTASAGIARRHWFFRRRTEG
jgi:hypothetical protein